MERQYIEKWFSNEGTRNDVRKRVLDVFMDEEPGTGADLEAKNKGILFHCFFFKLLHCYQFLW